MKAVGRVGSGLQVFTLFKSSRTHMMLACCLKEPAPELPPGKQGVLSVRSQQNFLSKSMKQVTGVITLEDGELVHYATTDLKDAKRLVCSPVSFFTVQPCKTCCSRWRCILAIQSAWWVERPA